jgi:anti-sigma28 factor (negative regulator of flagellin synthesis)
VDEAKVAAISSALAEGKYQIVPERIADGLMHLEQALAPLGEK